jgi:hypothetical protein
VDGCLYALNLDGSLRWRLRTGGVTESSPVIGLDGTIYVGVLEHLWAIHPGGKKKWGSPGGLYLPWESTPVVLADGTILCFWNAGLWGFSAERDGLWNYSVLLYHYGSPAVGPTGTIYVPDATKAIGGLAALPNGVPLARSPWPRFRGNARNTGNALDQ